MYSINHHTFLSSLPQRKPSDVIEWRPKGTEYVPYTVQDSINDRKESGRGRAFRQLRAMDYDYETGRSRDARERSFDFQLDMTDRVGSGMMNVLQDECDRLERRGILEKNYDVRTHDGFYDIINKLGQVRLDPKWSRDAQERAPNLYMFQETIRMTEKLVEEDFTSLSARQLFPAMNLGTWMNTWQYRRQQESDHGFPEFIDIVDVPSTTNSGQQVNRQPETRNLAFFQRSAHWTEGELLRYAEAVANNRMPAYSIQANRLALARKSMLHWENLLVFFGQPNHGVYGILGDEANTRIPRTTAPFQFGSGSNPAEAARRLLVDFVADIKIRTEDVLQPDFVGLPTLAYNFITTRLFNTTSADTDRSIYEVAAKQLAAMGVTIGEVPELGFRQVELDRLLTKGSGLDEAEARRLAGGIPDPANAGESLDIMLVMRRDPNIGEMIIGRDLTPWPEQSTIRGRHEVRFVMSSGGWETYKPEGIRLVTDIGPDGTLFDQPVS